MYQKTKIFITLGSLIPLLEINPKEIVYNIDKVLGTMMFVEMSLKMVKIRNNLDIQHEGNSSVKYNIFSEKYYAATKNFYRVLNNGGIAYDMMLNKSI